jgi:RNA polymerase sigma factor (sigma-70 family)
LTQSHRQNLVDGLSGQEFLRLYEERSEVLLRFFVRRTLDPEAAADLTAETFAAAYASRVRFDPDKGEPGAWLFGIAQHQLHSYLRTLRVERKARDRVGLPHRQLDQDDYQRIEELIDFAEVGRRLQQALGELADDQRVAVTLRVVNELSYDQIAGCLSCSKETARARVSRGLAVLAKIVRVNDDFFEGISS